MKTDSSPVISLATPEEAAVSARRTGAGTITAQLNELSYKFIDAAKIIDPSIKGGWVGREVNDDQRMFAVHLERDNNPFVRHPEPGDAA